MASWSLAPRGSPTSHTIDCSAFSRGGEDKANVPPSAADIYAAGDVANHPHPVFGRVQVEHDNSAEKHGAAAARLMLGSAAPNDYIHYFWSDQYEHTLQHVGHATNWAVGFDRGGDPEHDRDSEMAACARLVAGRARPNRGPLAQPARLSTVHMDAVTIDAHIPAS